MLCGDEVKRCLNPCVSWGDQRFSVCRMHGARRSAYPTGAAAPNFRHGRMTAEALREDRETMILLRYLEDWSFAFGLVVPGSPKWRGRKPSKNDEG